MKVKRPSQHRCDGVPDTIKAFSQFKEGGGGYFLIHSFPKLLMQGGILSNYSPNLSFRGCVRTSYLDIFYRNKERAFLLVDPTSTLVSSMGIVEEKMSTPSMSRSSTMGDEGYFDYRESMER